jgi:hypothetical protein
MVVPANRGLMVRRERRLTDQECAALGMALKKAEAENMRSAPQ